MLKRIGIIGGTGIYSPELFEEIREEKVGTPYGSPSDTIKLAKMGNKEIAFLPRHGRNHSIPPHKVNYRANIWALKELGVERIISVCAVGSLREDYKPGDIVVCDQFIDMTKNRCYTFYDGGKCVHIGVAEPFCEEMRGLAIDVLKKLNLNHHPTGCYVCIEGPRFSTKAESKVWRMLGGDIIGMTLVPEVVLAKELEMCYVSIATITDYDVWKEKPVDAAEVVRVMKENNHKIMEFLKEFIPFIPEERKCSCKNSLKNAVV